MKYHEALEIPSQCQNCPVLKSIGNQYEHLTDEANSIIMGMMSGSSEERVIAELVSGGMDTEEAVRVVAEEHATFHEYTTADVEQIDAMRDTNVSLGRKTIDACEVAGTLSMRAKRGDREITATVCMSDMTGVLGQLGEFEPVKVRRKIVE